MKIFLPNPAAKSDYTRQAYAALGLNAFQIQQVTQGRSKSEYFISTHDHWTKITWVWLLWNHAPGGV
jgi:hypothetical protein